MHMLLAAVCLTKHFRLKGQRVNMFVRSLVPLAVWVFLTHTANTLKAPLRIGGLLHTSGSSPAVFFGQTALVGAQRAVDDINARSDVLPDYELKFQCNNSEVSLFSRHWTYLVIVKDQSYHMVCLNTS